MNKKELALQKARAIRQGMRKETHTFWHDFREFAFKGDVIDLAVGIIIGAGFNKVVQSLTSDIIMPIFGRILGNVAFNDLFINLSTDYYATLADAEAAGVPVIKYGLFITNVLDFLIVALTLFIVLQIFLRKKREEEVEVKA